MNDVPGSDDVTVTAAAVSAWVRRNVVSAELLPKVIAIFHRQLHAEAAPAPNPQPATKTRHRRPRRSTDHPRAQHREDRSEVMVVDGQEVVITKLPEVARRRKAPV